MSLNFRCASCGQMSSLDKAAEGRGDVRRMSADPNRSYDVTFYCDLCGAANSVTIRPEMIPALISRLSSNDPEIQKAIDDAKRGDYGRAINEAIRRFRF